MAINRLEPVVQSALILGPYVGQETTRSRHSGKIA